MKFMDKTAIIGLLNYYYHILASSLPMDDSSFIAELSNHNLLPGNVTALLESLSTSKEKASYFLNNIIKAQLEDNDNTYFCKLLAVIAKTGRSNLTNLAAMIFSAAKFKRKMQANSKQIISELKCIFCFCSLLAV